MDIRDYYLILGVPPTASIKEISHSYRKLAQQHHPDHQLPEIWHQAELHMKMLNETYEVLQDFSCREDYDRKYAHAFDRKVSSSHTRSQTKSNSHSFGKQRSLGLAIITLAFPIIGAYYLFIVWSPIFDELLNIFKYPNEFLLLVVWLFIIVRMVFKILPFTRRKSCSWQDNVSMEVI